MATQHPCPHCPGLRAEVAQLQATVAMLQRIIADARNECAALAGEADKVLADNVAPGVWSWNTSQKKAAGRVLERLKG